jgi:putative tricarboxylic transport membrane protein
MSDDVHSSQGMGSPGQRSNTFRGGLLIAVGALLLLMLTYSIPNPLVPRILTILIGVVGVVTAFGFIPVRGPQDYYGGLVLVMLATLAIIASSDLPGQHGFAFGPGTAPRLFAGILGALGAAVAVVGVVADGPVIEKYKLRGPLFVLAAICLFAAIIRPFGLVISSFAAFMLSISGSDEMRWIESIIGAAVMTLLCVLLFAYLLNLPFQLWWQPNAFQLLWQQTSEFLLLVFGPLMKFLHIM